MKLQINLIGLLTGSSLLLATPTVAANLDLTTWDTLGDVRVVNPNLVNLSNNALSFDDDGLGLDEDYNFSNNPAVDNFAFDLETELGLAPGTLDLDLNNFEYAYEGSALKTIVNVQAGDKLSFEWNFLTNETLTASSLPDYGFFLLDDIVIKLADFNDVSIDSTNYHRETGLQTYNYTFANGGERTIAFGIVDIGDYDVSSALTISNVALTSNDSNLAKTPEPSLIISLFCLGTLGLGKLHRRVDN